MAVLTLIGIRQSFPQRRSWRQALVIPIVVMVLCLYGVVSVFAQPTALPSGEGKVCEL